MKVEATTGRILVVDDNPVDRSLLVRFLAGEGHETIEADSGEQALELLHDGAVERGPHPARPAHARAWMASRPLRRSRATR